MKKGRVNLNTTKQLKAVLGIMLLTLGLALIGGDASAKDSKDVKQKIIAPVKQADKPQPDNNLDTSKKEGNKQGRDELPPTLTLSAPTNGSASLYPAALTVAASVTFPDEQDAKRDDKREEGRKEGNKQHDVEIEFLANGVKFAEAERAPYQASYVPPKAGSYTLTARFKYREDRYITAAPVTVVSASLPTVSLTAPAASTVITSPASFTLSANAGSSTGSIAKVEFYNGSTLIGTATSAPYSSVWTNVPFGTYAVTAKATDNYGFSSSSSPVSVVSNASPIVSLTSPANNAVAVAPGSFTLTANASDPDGTVAKVEFYNGTTLIGTASTAPYSFIWKNVSAGSYSITAKAIDNYGASSTSGAISVISDALPVVSLASPAANTVTTAPGSFTLTATATSSTSTIVKVDYYNGATWIGTASAAPYSFSWSNVPAGTYSITAKATDALGTTNTSPPVSLISNAPPIVNLTSPASNSSYTSPANITFTANASDPDGTVSKVDFYANNAGINTLIGTATTVTSGIYSVTWNTAPVGSYSITAVATDNMGAQTTSAINTLTVIAPPVVSLTAPANNTVVTAPGSFTLTATASSAGSIAKVDFYAVNTGAAIATSTLIGTVTTAPYSFNWANVPAGHYNLIAVATDANGVSTTSSAVAVISNQAPSVNLTSPAMNAVSVAPGSFTLTANATDPDGTIVKVDYYASSTDAAGAITNILIGTASTAPYSFTWTNVAAGNYSLTAVATDDFGASSTSSAISVISDALPSISLTSPLNNAVSVAPGSFTLTASATSSTSSIAKVDFYQGTTLIGTATTAIGGTGNYSFTWANIPAGTYSLTAVATDALGTTATSAAVNVTSDAPPSITLTSPATGARITSPNSFILTADAASITSTIAKVEFYNGTTLIGTATAAPYLFTWNNVPVGNYSLTAKATDALGIATTSGAINVTAIANVPPTVSLIGPVNGATVKVPGSFTLTANAASTTSGIAKVEFYASSNASGTITNTLIGTATTATGGSYSYTWSNVPLGTYSLTAKVTDTLNASTTSAAITVTVNTGIAQAYYIHADHLDSPRQITDTNGNIVWQWDNNDPFGNNIPNENPTNQGAFEFPLRFPGQYADKETNLNYNINRDYDSSIGRYIQSDPIGLEGGINTYAYVEGNPLRYRDPYGLYSWGEFGTDAANGIVGFGDGVSSVLTLGMYSAADARNSLGIQGNVNQCSASYSGGKYAGYVWGAATMWAAGLNGGANSVFWAGKGASTVADTLGTTIAQTPIGAVLNGLGVENRIVWGAASATFAGNATGTATAVLNYVATDSLWLVERAILNWRNIPIVVH